MAIEESKISDLITSYKEYERQCRDSSNPITRTRAEQYREVIKDLESLLPRKTLAELGVTHYSNLTGTVVEYKGMRGVLLGGGGNMVALFTFADKCATYTDPALVNVLDEDRIWDETGRIL